LEERITLSMHWLRLQVQRNKYSIDCKNNIIGLWRLLRSKCNIGMQGELLKI
jgi:hypothetical protein